VANNAAFKYEGVAFYAYAAPLSTGTAPVHRFYSPVSKSHFYTISDAEKNIVATNPNYTYEGTSWNAQLAAGGTAVPIYRFYNPSRGTHFFTINEQEKNIVLTNPTYVFEGAAYYGWTTQ
jgi:lysyl endopeptidase